MSEFKQMTREEFFNLQNIEKQKLSLNTTKSGYRLVLTPHFEHSNTMTEEEHKKIDELNEPVEFDLITEKSINATSEITQYPTVTGDTIADHMIKKPCTMSISGIFSLYGNKPHVFKGGKDRLTNIQSFFEKIKNEGTLCTLATIDRASNSKQRFVVRNQMVLTSITWTESQNSMTFSFQFNEVLSAEVFDPVVDYTDENLPTTTDPVSLNFADEFLDPQQISAIVLNQLQEVGLLKNDFALWLSKAADTLKNIAMITSVPLIITGASILSHVIVGATILGSAGPVGWIVGGVLLAAGIVACGIIAILNRTKTRKAEKEYGIKAFSKKDTEDENTQEAERLCNYIGQVNTNLEYLNNAIQVFGLQTSIEQQCLLYIGEHFYTFTFTKNNTQTKDKNVIWKLSLTSDAEDNFIVDIADVSNSALTNINDFTLDNCIYKTDDEIYIYLANNKLYAVENNTYNSEEERNKAIEECKSNLENYVILASKTNMEEFALKLNDVVIDAMKV